MCDLALTLGMTIGSLKDSMSRDELSLWLAYVEENGPLNLALRIESAVARAVAPFLKNTTPKELMIWPREQEPEATKEDAFILFKSLAGRTKARSN